MEVIYATEKVPNTVNKSIFLAGPTPRSLDVESWRNEALSYLKNKGFDGVVFIPEPRDQKWHKDYDRQVNWEEDFLNMADCIVFWVPRELETMPAFTTNVEFGAWCESGKVVFGAPPDAPKNTYLKHYATKYNIPSAETLEETLDAALTYLGDGAERKDSEVTIPLFVWKTESFQSWYRNLQDAGNKLQHARVLWSFRPGYKSFVFLWVLSVAVYITSENRSKTNEFVLARPDISSVMLWNRQNPIHDSKIVLVREFRSPANTSDQFIRELPGGSSKSKQLPVETAAEEVFEETGFVIESNRLLSNGSRQLAGTLSSHKSELFSAEISEKELEFFLAQKDIVHGNVNDTERTFIEVLSVKDILENKDIDWTTVGQILSIINKN